MSHLLDQATDLIKSVGVLVAGIVGIAVGLQKMYAQAREGWRWGKKTALADVYESLDEHEERIETLEAKS